MKKKLEDVRVNGKLLNFFRQLYYKNLRNTVGLYFSFSATLAIILFFSSPFYRRYVSPLSDSETVIIIMSIAIPTAAEMVGMYTLVQRRLYVKVIGGIVIVALISASALQIFKPYLESVDKSAVEVYKASLKESLTNERKNLAILYINSQLRPGWGGYIAEKEKRIVDLEKEIRDLEFQQMQPQSPIYDMGANIVMLTIIIGLHVANVVIAYELSKRSQFKGSDSDDNFNQFALMRHGKVSHKDLDFFMRQKEAASVLREKLQQDGLSQIELCERYSFDAGEISRILNWDGTGRKPSEAVMAKLRTQFGNKAENVEEVQPD